MLKNIVRSSMVVLALGFAACDEAPITAPVNDGDTVFDPAFDVTGPPDGGSCPDVFYEESELLDNGVTVTWTTVLAGFEYTEGENYVADVNWSVDLGTATYVNFTDRHGPNTWTPKGSSGMDVDGLMSVGDDGDGTVAVTVSMTPMHAAEAGQIGNGHFWVRLEVDDGAGNVETVKLGVNFHLEEPADGAGNNCPS